MFLPTIIGCAASCDGRRTYISRPSHIFATAVARCRYTGPGLLKDVDGYKYSFTPISLNVREIGVKVKL